MKNRFARLLVTAAISSIFFTSCENFMDGSLLKADIDSTIEDANTERVNITISTLNSYGTLIGEKGGTYKLGTENHELNFAENKGFQFVYWNVKDASGNETGSSSSDAIYIANPYSAKTTFSVKAKAQGYKIEAVCAPRPNVELTSPFYIANGVNADSSIEITFAQSVEKENFIFTQQEFEAYGQFAKSIRSAPSDETSPIVGILLGNDKIYKNVSIVDSEGSNISSHYKAPVLSDDGKKLVLEADTSNCFGFSEKPVLDVFVTLSKKIGYDFSAKDGKKVRILPEKAFDYNFKVSATTTAKAKINFSAKNDEDKVMGTLNWNGQQEFNIGQTVQVEFVPDSAFEFIGWNVLGNEENAVLTKADGTTLTINVLKAIDTVKIVPVCREKGVAEISIYTKVGSVEHSEPRSYRVGEEFSVTINHDSLYYFPGWKIRNSVVDELLSDEDRDMYFYSEDWSKETATIKVVKECSNLVVEGGVYYRPFINLREPVNNPDGTNRNQSIKVYFDKAIDPMSLYYTGAEIKAIQRTVDGVADFIWKSNRIGGVEYYYGYEFNGERHYKNITIINNNTDENYTKYYDAPYLEPNGKTLVIPVVKEYDQSDMLDKTKLPPANTEISVEIGTEYTHLENGLSIPLERNSNSNWFFTTNSKIDEIAPVVNSYTITGTNLTGSFTMKADSDVGKTKPTTIEAFKNVYLKKDTRLVINANIQDDSKNLKYVYLCYKKIVDEKYNDIASASQETKRVTLKFAHADEPEKYTVDDYVYLSRMDSGLYEIWISAQDEVNNEGSSGHHYVLVDNAGPDKNNTVDISTMKFFKNGTKIKFCDWTDLEKSLDYDKSEMYVYRKYASGHTDYEMNSGKVIILLDEDAEIRIEVWSSDVFGNQTCVYTQSLWEIGYYSPKLRHRDYFYTNGWFSPCPDNWYNSAETNYAGYEVFGKYAQFEAYDGQIMKYIVSNVQIPLEEKSQSAANTLLSTLNNNLPATLKGKVTFVYPPETFLFEKIYEITHYSVYFDDEDKTKYFYVINPSGALGLREYKPGYTGYQCDISKSNKAFAIPVAELPTADFE